MTDREQLPCDVCGRLKDYGHGRYDLKKVEGYHMWVCPTCWEGNWDGWSPLHEEAILTHLKKVGMPVPPRLPNGLLPRTWSESG